MKTKQIYLVCNAGRERSRMLASAINDELGLEVAKFRGSTGFNGSYESKDFEYEWVPSEGFIDLVGKEGLRMSKEPSQVITLGEIVGFEPVLALDRFVANRLNTYLPSAVPRSSIITVTDYLHENNLQFSNPFPDYLKGSIPDAHVGYIEPTILQRGLRENNSSIIALHAMQDPLKLRDIPLEFRTYLGEIPDSDEAYRKEAGVMLKLGGLIASRIRK